jgi:hypothetical protein
LLLLTSTARRRWESRGNKRFMFCMLDSHPYKLKVDHSGKYAQCPIQAASGLSGMKNPDVIPAYA